jgi:cell filamentation protein
MKYAIGSEQDQFEPGSDNKVLKNKLGIFVEQDMHEAENSLLLKLYEYLYEPEFAVATLSFADILVWHRKWLGNVYSWAGTIRSVNMGKGGFQFAAAQRIPALIATYERDYFQGYAELATWECERLIGYLASSHVEFILIHPFREGNGRISRLLMDVLATQAGYGPLDYSLWDQHKDFYFKAIQAGHAGDSQHMERLVRDVLGN